MNWQKVSPVILITSESDASLPTELISLSNKNDFPKIGAVISLHYPKIVEEKLPKYDCRTYYLNPSSYDKRNMSYDIFAISDYHKASLVVMAEWKPWLNIPKKYDNRVINIHYGSTVNRLWGLKLQAKNIEEKRKVEYNTVHLVKNKYSDLIVLCKCRTYITYCNSPVDCLEHRRKNSATAYASVVCKYLTKSLERADATI